MKEFHVTPALVRGLYAHMRQAFGATVENKRRHFGMMVLAVAQEKLGGWDREFFVNRIPTTIGHTMYLPFEVGVPKTGWTLWQQILTCAHQCQAIVQQERVTALGHLVGHLRCSTRLEREAERYRSDIELDHWRTGQLMSARSLCELMQVDLPRGKDLRRADEIFLLAADGVRTGELRNVASIVAIDWLEKNTQPPRQLGVLL